MAPAPAPRRQDTRFKALEDRYTSTVRLYRVLALDIGTKTIKAIQGDVDISTGSGIFHHISAVATRPTTGFYDGELVSEAELRYSIEYVLADIYGSAGSVSEKAHISVSAAHIKCTQARGETIISNPVRGPIQKDITEALNNCDSDALTGDSLVIHAIPKLFQVDDKPAVSNPTGIPGYKLTAITDVIYGDAHQLISIANVINRTGIRTQELVFAGVAAAEAALKETEKESGVCLLDIGARSTSLVVYQQGELRLATTLPIGGSHVSSDIAFGLNIPVEAAEALKCRTGHCCPDFVTEQEIVLTRSQNHVAQPATNAESDPNSGSSDKIENSQHGDQQTSPEGEALIYPPRRIRRRAISLIMHARMEEIYLCAKKELTAAGFFEYEMPRVVITGGAANAEGAIMLAQRVFEVECSPGGCKGRSIANEPRIETSQFAVAAGMALYVAKNAAELAANSDGTDPLRSLYNTVAEIVRRRIIAP
jgi:cell division protein FtsA